MEKEEQLRRNIANNLTNYRKESGLTQLQLAEKLNYSDKAISKWERGESIPDIYILSVLADLYGCSIDDLISDKLIYKKPLTRNRIIITLMSLALVWLVTIVTFTIWTIIGTSKELNQPYYFTWFYGLLASFIILTVFGKIWGKRFYRFFYVSGIVWSTGLVLFFHLLHLNVPSSWLVWCICAGVQILVVLWYCLTRKAKK